MKSIGITQRSIWAGLALLLLLASLLLLLSPEERELGSGIKSIYVHVALTWTGMSGLIIAGLVGLASAVLNRENLQSWAISITWVALGFFAFGLVMSVIAAGINWGAGFLAGTQDQHGSSGIGPRSDSPGNQHMASSFPDKRDTQFSAGGYSDGIDFYYALGSASGKRGNHCKFLGDTVYILRPICCCNGGGCTDRLCPPTTVVLKN